ncbi:MAG: heavy-metal-associated domain-containing protein [Gemmatimonadota bacterium]
MIGSWKLPAFAVAGAIGTVAFLCPACGGGGRAEGRSPSVSEPAASTTSVGAPAEAVIERVEFDVAGMTCGGCATATEIALERLDGVRSAEAEYDEETGAGRAVVRYDSARVSPERMIEAGRGGRIPPDGAGPKLRGRPVGEAKGAER